MLWMKKRERRGIEVRGAGAGQQKNAKWNWLARRESLINLGVCVCVFKRRDLAVCGR